MTVNGLIHYCDHLDRVMDMVQDGMNCRLAPWKDLIKNKLNIAQSATDRPIEWAEHS